VRASVVVLLFLPFPGFAAIVSELMVIVTSSLTTTLPVSLFEPMYTLSPVTGGAGDQSLRVVQ
jgi:hypothetical protein